MNKTLCEKSYRQLNIAEIITLTYNVDSPHSKFSALKLV